MQKYSVDLPYPSLDDIKPNIHDIRPITEDYSGLISEFSAVGQYFYNHLFANHEEYGEIGKTLMGIAIVEMHHLNMLGEVILKLGGNPKLIYPKQQKNLWWSSNLINYQTEIHHIIKSAIVLEKQAIEQYKKHIEIISQKAVSDVILRILKDEYLHLEIFENILKTL